MMTKKSSLASLKKAISKGDLPDPPHILILSSKDSQTPNPGRPIVSACSCPTWKDHYTSCPESAQLRQRHNTHARHRTVFTLYWHSQLCFHHGREIIIPPPPPARWEEGGGGGRRREVLCIYHLPDHVQLILQPYTRLDTENPYPIPDFLFLELYHLSLLLVLMEYHLSTTLICHDDFFLSQVSIPILVLMPLLSVPANDTL